MLWRVVDRILTSLQGKESMTNSFNYCLFYVKLHKLLYARHEKSVWKLERKWVIFLRMRTPPIPIPNALLSSSAVYARVDACFVNECSVAVHAHPTLSGLLVAL